MDKIKFSTFAFYSKIAVAVTSTPSLPDSYWIFIRRLFQTQKVPFRVCVQRAKLPWNKAFLTRAWHEKALWLSLVPKTRPTWLGLGTQGADSGLRDELCDPPINPNLHPSWDFVAFLNYVALCNRSYQLTLVHNCLHWKYIKVPYVSHEGCVKTAVFDGLGLRPDLLWRLADYGRSTI